MLKWRIFLFIWKKKILGKILCPVKPAVLQLNRQLVSSAYKKGTAPSLLYRDQAILSPFLSFRP